jgi:hypothetical protein
MGAAGLKIESSGAKLRLSRLDTPHKINNINQTTANTPKRKIVCQNPDIFYLKEKKEVIFLKNLGLRCN